MSSERGGAAVVRGRAAPTRLEAVRSVDMAASNAWAEFSAIYCRTRQAHLEHEGAKAERC
jgi:hypothetical protein